MTTTVVLVIHSLTDARSAFFFVRQALFALIFTIARMIAGPPLTYYTVINPQSHIIVKAGAVGILLVSLLWFSKIVDMLSKVLRKKKDK